MENWRKPYIDHKLRKMFQQAILMTFQSLIVLSLVTSLFLWHHYKSCDEELTQGDLIFIIFSFIFLVFLFNNLNSIFIQLIHYLRIFPFFMYSWKCVLIESFLFSILTFISFNIDLPYMSIFILCLPGSILLIFILLFRYVFRVKYNAIVDEYKHIFNNMEINEKYSYGKILDMVLGLFIPCSIIIIGGILFYG